MWVLLKNPTELHSNLSILRWTMTFDNAKTHMNNEHESSHDMNLKKDKEGKHMIFISKCITHRHVNSNALWLSLLNITLQRKKVNIVFVLFKYVRRKFRTKKLKETNNSLLAAYFQKLTPQSFHFHEPKWIHISIVTCMNWHEWKSHIFAM